MLVIVVVRLMKKGKEPRRAQLEPPPFTGALDARVPAENVILSHFVDTARQWVAASEASDGRVFLGRAKTEPLARRAAGLRTLHHLEERAAGRVHGLDDEAVKDARAELLEQLGQLRQLIEAYNEPFPSTIPREAALLHVRAAQAIVREGEDRGALARWVLPPLLFLAGAFAEGAIGVYAEKAIEALARLLSA